MKRLPVMAFVFLAGAFTAASLRAQNHEVRADLPFSFAVGSKQFPAGHYTFLTGPRYTTVIPTIDNEILVLSKTEEAFHAVGRLNILVFNKYGDEYFLREIRCPSIAMNVEIPQSKQEKRIRLRAAGLGANQTLLALK